MENQWHLYDDDGNTRDINLCGNYKTVCCENRKHFKDRDYMVRTLYDSLIVRDCQSMFQLVEISKENKITIEIT